MNPRIPPAIIIGIGPTLKHREAMTAAANSSQLLQCGKFSLTTLKSKPESRGVPLHATLNIRMIDKGTP